MNRYEYVYQSETTGIRIKIAAPTQEGANEILSYLVADPHRWTSISSDSFRSTEVEP